MEKFNRSYKAVFTIGKIENTKYIRDKDKVQTVIITSGKTDYKGDGYAIGGYSLDFRVERTVYSTTANIGQFKFKNLPKEVQALLWRDRYQADKFVLFELYAGYQSTQPKIFQGEFTQCYTYRQGGETDFITEIEANNFTAFFEYGLANMTMQKSTEFDYIVRTIADFSPNGLKAGYLTKDIPPIRKATTYRGNALDVFSSDYSGFQIYIDNGYINVLNENDVIPSDITVITAESGLLGSPRRSENVLEAEIIFEPGLVMGQQVQLLSDSMSWLNQRYKVIGLSHEGTISPSECGRVRTKVQLWLGTALFNELKATNYTHEQKATGEWLYPLAKQGQISSPFGKRKTNIPGASDNHKGVDIAIPKLTDVLATNNGIVTKALRYGGYGLYMQIDHGTINGVRICSAYGHLNSLWLAEGTKVTKGQKIASSGNSGVSSGPHLHFEMLENGIQVNPSKYIKGV